MLIIINNRFVQYDNKLFDLKYVRFIQRYSEDIILLDEDEIESNSNDIDLVIKAFKICKGLEKIELNIDWK